MDLAKKLTVDWIFPVALVLLVALPNLGHPPTYDEILHYIAAMGLLEHGELIVAQGHYPRGALFTTLVAGSFKLFGVSDISARVPSLIASMAWAVAVYTFTRKADSRTSAWICLVIFLAAPTIITITQTSRFYSLHALLFFSASILIYVAVFHYVGIKRALSLLLAGVLLGASYHLQLTTIIGIVSLVTWLLIVAFPTIRDSLRRRHRRSIVFWASLGLGSVGLFVLVLWDVIVYHLGATSLWATERASAYAFYPRVLGKDFGFVWPLFPFFALIAFRVRPRAVTFAMVIFVMGMILHTIAGQKAARYISYLMPYFCIVAGIGIAATIGMSQKRLASYLTESPRRSFRRPSLAPAIIAVFLVFTVLNNPTTVRALKGLVRASDTSVAEGYARVADWKLALPELSQYLDPSSVLISSSGPKALFYIGFYDYELSVSVVAESRSGAEFGVDGRTGGLVISEHGSLKHIIDCSTTGVAIIDESKWRMPYNVSPAVADYIEQSIEPIPLPAAARMRAYRWEHPTSFRTDCDDLPRSRSKMNTR